MLPLYLLTNAKGQQMSIELKNGEVVEGELTNVDNWMNLTLSNVTQYESTGESGVKTTEVYLRGTYIKYIKMSDSIIDQVKQQINSNHGNANGGNRRNNKYNNAGSGPGQNGNYRRNNQNRKPYNSNAGNQRRYNQHPRQQQQYQQQGAQSNGTGGYVQQHQSLNSNVEF
ncbi:hypothetical protein HG535_0E04430 [Zygotorulaspora mrakii]|uniref:LSM complex subunit LSM4 n=1 Tax=Zygotorulaspora mrakii TaxID=42260 RepID=A0A7H9B5W7_ZYGMR|nr:uncharacterized protein HG535_0E04430 [Zygotorulaspora mrakii]QLG73359.1 hypothetical protein HG535_0E04430 [Zygotorulaspora mrakii]